MRLTVDTCVGWNGIEMPQRFRFGRREIDVGENIDRWFGAGYCYFKLTGADGNLYILRHDEAHDEWDLTMFEDARLRSITARRRAGENRAANVET